MKINNIKTNPQDLQTPQSRVRNEILEKESKNKPFHKMHHMSLIYYIRSGKTIWHICRFNNSQLNKETKKCFYFRKVNKTSFSFIRFKELNQSNGIQAIIKPSNVSNHFTWPCMVAYPQNTAAEYSCCFKKFHQRWSPWRLILKSLVLASKPHALKNCPVLGSKTARIFES